MNDVSGSTDVSGFDGDLQMFREPAKPVNMAHLQFLRWLIEHGRLDDRSVHPPNGKVVEASEPNRL
jgi:hypothetical protein